MVPGPMLPTTRQCSGSVAVATIQVALEIVVWGRCSDLRAAHCAADAAKAAEGSDKIRVSSRPAASVSFFSMRFPRGRFTRTLGAGRCPDQDASRRDVGP